MHCTQSVHWVERTVKRAPVLGFMGPNTLGVLFLHGLIAQDSRAEGLSAAIHCLGTCSSEDENLKKDLSRRIPALFMAQQLVLMDFNCLAAVTHNVCDQKGYDPAHSWSSLEMLSLATQDAFGYLNLNYVVLQFSGEGNQLVSWTRRYEGHMGKCSLESSLISASYELNSKGMGQ